MAWRDTLGRLLAVVPLGWGLSAVGLDVLGDRPPPDGQWDAIVVAGCRVRPDGTPSEALKRRTELAVSLWQAGVAPQIILTGGVGTHPPAEATVAAQHAASLGVPAAALVVEDRSVSTEQNAAYAAAISQASRVVVVTDRYHVLRAERVFARHFDAATGVGSKSPGPIRIRGALREVAALGWYAVRGRL